MMLWTSVAAASLSAPVGSPCASRTMTPPGGSGSRGGDARELQRQRIDHDHVRVVAPHRNRDVRGDAVDQLARRQCRLLPECLVPVAPQQPLALRRVGGALTDATRELLGARDIVQLQGIERRAAQDQVHMRIVEARHQALARRLDHARRRPAPRHHVPVVADGHDAPVQHGERLRLRALGIAGPDFRVADDQVGRGTQTLSRGRAERNERGRQGSRNRTARTARRVHRGAT